MLSRSTLAPLLIAAMFATMFAGVSCERAGDTPEVEERAPLESTQNGEPVPGSDGTSQEEEHDPPVIYYDLTRFEWYARGEPMRLDDGAYAARGAPVRGATSGMRRQGEYEGVEYYVRVDEPDSADVVYIPVFEGFWLPFSRE